MPSRDLNQHNARAAVKIAKYMQSLVKPNLKCLSCGSLVSERNET